MTGGSWISWVAILYSINKLFCFNFN
jgi:hypothetical protein